QLVPALAARGAQAIAAAAEAVFGLVVRLHDRGQRIVDLIGFAIDVVRLLGVLDRDGGVDGFAGGGGGIGGIGGTGDGIGRAPDGIGRVGRLGDVAGPAGRRGDDDDLGDALADDTHDVAALLDPVM